MFRRALSIEKTFALPLRLVPGAAPAPSPLAASQDVSSGSREQLWSDYLNVPLHPKSVYVIRQYMHDGYGPEVCSRLCHPEQDLSVTFKGKNFRGDRERAFPPPPLFLGSVVV